MLRTEVVSNLFSLFKPLLELEIGSRVMVVDMMVMVVDMMDRWMDGCLMTVIYDCLVLVL